MISPAAISAARLYAIFDTAYADPQHLEKTLCALLVGGADIIQIRAKNLPQEKILPLALRARKLLDGSKIPLIINDHPQIANDCGADGVHLGQHDGDIPQTRAACPGLIIGRSTHSLIQALAAQKDGANYIGFGPLFPTPTKAGRPAIGLGDLKNLHRAVHIPAFAIGGIKLHNLKEVVAAGARRVVIVSGLLQSTDVSAACRQAKDILLATPLDDD